MLVAGVLLAIGCGKNSSDQPSPPASSSSSSAAVTIATGETSYTAGAPVPISIVNNGTDTLAFNPCTRILEHEGGGSWATFTEPNRMCTMEAWILGAHETRPATITLPDSIAAGTYRIAINFGAQAPGGGQFNAYSNTFNIK